MPARTRQPPMDQHELYGVFDVTARPDALRDAFKSLVRQPDSELGSRYPAFSAIPSSSARSSSALHQDSSPRRYHHDDVENHTQQFDQSYPESRSWHDKNAASESKKSKKSVPKPQQQPTNSTPSSSGSPTYKLSKKKPAPPMPPTKPFRQNNSSPPASPLDNPAPVAFPTSITEPHEPQVPFKRAMKPRNLKSALKGGSNPPLEYSPYSAPSTPSDGGAGRTLPHARPAPSSSRSNFSRSMHSNATSNMLPVIPESPQGDDDQPYTFSPPTTHTSFTTSRHTSVFSPQSGSRSCISSMAFSASSVANTSPHEIQQPLPSEPGSDRSSPPRGPLRLVNPDSDSDRHTDNPPQYNNSDNRRHATKSESRSGPPVPAIPPQFIRSNSDPNVQHERQQVPNESPKPSPRSKRNVSIKDEASYFDGSSVPSRSHGYPRTTTDTQSNGRSSSGQGRPAPRKSKSHPPPTPVPSEWIYPLPLSLEELYNGDQHQYKITQHLLDGTTRDQFVDINVQPGWKNGTRIIFPKMGNQRPDGSYQDVIFVVEQLHHERFARLDGGRLVVNHEIDFTEALKDGSTEKRRPLWIKGLNGKAIDITVNKGIIQNGMETVVRGHGMPMRSKSRVVGNGDLIVRWSIRYPHHFSPSQLQAMRRVLEM